MAFYAESFARWLADYYLLTTMLLVVTLTASWFITQPARRVALTRATLAGLALLAVFCALPGWSVVHLMAREAEIVPIEVASAPKTSEARAVESFPVVVPLEAAPLPTMPEPEHAPAKTASEPAMIAQVSISTVACLAFLVGTFLVLAWQLLGHWRARALVLNAAVAPPELQLMLTALSDATARVPPPPLPSAGEGIGEGEKPWKATRLLISPTLPTAVALGIFRPTILLPQKLVDTSDLAALRTILAHELAHIRHGDLRLLALCRALFVLLWANPLFWLLRRRLRLDQETLADAAAAEVSTRHQYAAQLVDWAKRFATDRPPALAAAVGLWESPSQLRRRIAVLLDERLTIWRECSRRWRIASLAVCAGVAVGLSLVTLEPGLAEPEKGDKKPIAAPEEMVEEGAKEYLAPIFISGRTLDRDGNRVAGATVYLASQRPGYRRIAETKSDEKGYYKFKDVKLPIARADTNQGEDSGGFEVFGTADGYAFTWRERKSFLPNKLHYLNVPGDPARERPTGYGAADPIVLDLTFGLPVTFRGRVVDDKGQPIPNTVLDIRYADSEWDRADYNSMSYTGALSSLNEREIVPRNLKTRKTDTEGRFEFTNLPFDHRFSIWVHPPGFPTKRIWVVSNDTIDAKAKGNRVYNFNQEIVLEQPTPRNVPIQVVYGDTGEPAPKILVSAGGSSATTNIEGRAMLRIPDGDHTLHLLQQIGTPYRATETSLTVSENSVEQPARAELEPAALVNITVVDANTDEPLPGVDVWREEPIGDARNPYRPVHGYRSWEVETRISHYEEPRTDNDGKMRVLFAPGTHRIGIAKEAYPAGYTPVERDGVELELKAGEPVEVQFEMRRVGQKIHATQNATDGLPTVTMLSSERFILCPVTTDLQRSLLGDVTKPAVDVSLCVFVNGTTFADDQIDQDWPEFIQLRERLEEIAKTDNRKVVFRILLAPKPEEPFDQVRKRAEALSDLCELLGREAGFKRSTWSNTFYGNDFDWTKLSANARAAADRATSDVENPIGDDRVQAFPVRTYLSRLLVNADCVVNIVPVVGRSEGNRFPDDFVAEMKRIVPQLQYTDQKELLVRVRFAESAKEQLERWVNDIEGRKAFAKEFGFEFCNLSQSFTNEAEAALKAAAPDEVKQRIGILTARFLYDGPIPKPRNLAISKEVLDARNLEPIPDESLIVGKDGGIANVFVWVSSKDIPAPTAEVLPPVTVSVKNGQFTPHILAFRTSAQNPRELIFKNEQQFNVNCNYQGIFSTANLLLTAGERKSFRAKPERIPVPLTANINPWMKSYVFPLTHPYFGVSDESGTIRIDNLPPGDWEFVAWHERVGFLNTENWPRGRFKVAIEAGENDLGTIKIAGAAFEKEEAQAEAQVNTISGRCVDENGKPLAGVKIYLPLNTSWSPVRPETGRSATSDTDGRFEIEVPLNWPGGERILQLWAFLPGHELLPKGIDPTLLQQQKALSFTLTLKPSDGAEFVVLDPSGNPVASARVASWHFRINQSWTILPYTVQSWLSTTTDVKGKAALAGVSYDKLNAVRVETEQYGIQTVPVDHSESDLTLRLVEVGRIEGRVVADDAAAIRRRAIVVEFSPESYQGFATVVTDETGRFVIPRIAMGSGRIRVEYDSELPYRPLKDRQSFTVKPSSTTYVELPLIYVKSDKPSLSE